jgi:hypothetical protein
MLIECCACKEAFFISNNNEEKALKKHTHDITNGLFNILSVRQVERKETMTPYEHNENQEDQIDINLTPEQANIIEKVIILAVYSYVHRN